MTTGDLQIVAGALSFSTILSFIPFIAVTLAAIKYFNGFDSLYLKVEAIILQYFQDPTGKEGVEIIAKFFKRVQISKLGTWGFVGLVFSATLLVNDMERGFHKIWSLPQRRPFHRRLLIAWIFMILFPLALAIYVAITSLKAVSGDQSLVSITVINVLLTISGLTVIYKVLPNTKVANFSALSGALISTAGLFLLYRSFRWLSHSFLMLGKMYGSFAAMPALLLWILLTWIIVLLGAVIASSMDA